MTSRTKHIVIKIIAVTIALGLISSKTGCNAAAGPKNVCMTPGCISAASIFLKKINPKVNPCTNFYKFACGKFLDTAVIPKDKMIVFQDDLMHDRIQEQLRAILNEKTQPNEPRAFKKAKDFYEACMNKALIDQHGVTPLLDRLKSLGGWPVLDGNKWQDKKFDWIQAIYIRRGLGYSVQSFFVLSVDMDFKNNSKYVLSIDQVPLTLGRDYLVKGFSDKIVNAYYRYMVDTAVLLGADKVRAERELKESLEFEMKLAEISISREERRNPTKLYNPMSIKQLSENYKSIPWKEYINKIVKPDIEVGDDEMVNVRVPNYFKEFEKIMKETPKRTQANYAMWRAVHDSIDYLPDGIRNRQMQYYTVITGQAEREPRWKECLDMISNNLPLSVSALYIRKFFTKEAKKDASEMVNDIQEEFQQILKTVDWMDKETRMRALDKARSMIDHVGYPDELLDDKKLTQFYEKLEVKDNDYFQSNLNLYIFQLEDNLNRLRKPVNRSSWIDHGNSAIVNAFYSPNENSIIIPAGILQGEYFKKDYPKYINYGAIGQVIGHETTHGFDDEGRQFDKNGNMIDWWEPDTKKKFLSKAQCVVQQYGNFTDEEVGLNLKGAITQGENIADMGGVKISYLAYQKWAKQNGPEPMLPKLNYSPSQLFWISAANSWCTKLRPETLRLQITTDTHSPAEFRVLGPLMNMPEFAKDFNCPVVSKMNPTKRCSVW